MFLADEISNLKEEIIRGLMIEEKKLRACEERQVYLQLYDKKVMSTQTLLEKFNFDYNEEIERIQFDLARQMYMEQPLPKPEINSQSIGRKLLMIEELPNQIYMEQPLPKPEINSQSIGRKLLMVEELPKGALAFYERETKRTPMEIHNPQFFDLSLVQDPPAGCELRHPSFDGYVEGQIEFEE